uniref:Uncharacterized protein n=1 Tax=Panagrolaimus superbus TaxID=310955 RepID=A0A914YTM9_9BILA
METDREDNNVNSDEELDESLTFKYRKNKVVRHMRKFTVIDTRKKSRAIRCLYCRALLHSAISRHYSPGHSTCYRKITTLVDAHAAEKQLWRANVIDEAIITSAKIRSLLASTNNNAKIVAGYLDGSIVFGHYVQAVYATEFNAIRAEMKNL